MKKILNFLKIKKINKQESQKLDIFNSNDNERGLIFKDANEISETKILERNVYNTSSDIQKSNDLLVITKEKETIKKENENCDLDAKVYITKVNIINNLSDEENKYLFKIENASKLEALSCSFILNENDFKEQNLNIEKSILIKCIKKLYISNDSIVNLDIQNKICININDIKYINKNKIIYMLHKYEYNIPILEINLSQQNLFLEFNLIRTDIEIYLTAFY